MFENTNEFLELNEASSLETSDIVSEQLDFISSSEQLNTNLWNELSSGAKLDQLKIVSDKYASVTHCKPLTVIPCSVRELSELDDSVVGFYNGKEIHFNEESFSDFSISPRQAVSAVVNSYAEQQKVSFSGLTNLEGIVDQQQGGTCWLEACENFIQTHAGFPVDNDFSNRIYGQVVANPNRYGAVLRNGVLDGQMPKHPQELFNIPRESYPQLIYDMSGVKTKWVDFSHENLQNALSNNKGVLAVGMAKHLYGDPSITEAHAFMITDFRDGNYIGIDSNRPNQECVWTPEQIQKTIESYGTPKFLTSEGESTWLYKTNTLISLEEKLDTVIEQNYNRKQEIKTMESTNELSQNLENQPLEQGEQDFLNQQLENFNTSLEGLAPEDKLASLRNFETKCAEMDGRNPKILEVVELKQGDFIAAGDKILIDKNTLKELVNLDEDAISLLRKEVFSRQSEIKENNLPAIEGISCDDCSGSHKCYVGQGR